MINKLIICDECNDNKKKRFTCKKCRGKGRVDWIENIVGVKPQGYDEILDQSCKYLAEAIDDEVLEQLHYIKLGKKNE